MTVPAELPWEELDGNLRAFIRRRVRNPADVDDLVQRAAPDRQGIGNVAGSSRLHAWVYRTARNVIGGIIAYEARSRHRCESCR